MAYVLGLNAKIKIGSTELKNCKDVTLNLSTGEADVTTRANAGWRSTMATLKEASIDFTTLYDSEDTAFSALQTAFLNNTEVEVVIEGTGTFTATCMVTAFNISQPLEDACSVAVTLKPSGAEAPTFTTGA